MQRKLKKHKQSRQRQLAVAIAVVNSFSSLNLAALPAVMAVQPPAALMTTMVDGWGIEQLLFRTAYAGESVTGSKVITDSQTADGDRVESGGVQEVHGSASNTTVNSGGIQNVYYGGGAGNTTVNDGGNQTVYAGGSANNATVNSGGVLNLKSGGTATAVNLNKGYVLQADTGALMIANNDNIKISSGQAQNITLNDGGYLSVQSGHRASNTTINNGGTQTLTGGSASFTTVNSGGAQLINNGAKANDTVINGGVQHVYAGGSATTTTINNGGSQNVHFGGSASKTTINNGAGQNVYAGGSVDKTTVNSGGVLKLVTGSTATAATLNNGYVLQADTGAKLSANNGTTTIINGQAQNITLNRGGWLSVESGHNANDTIANAGGVLKLASGATVSGTTTLNQGRIEWDVPLAVGTNVKLDGTITAVAGSTINLSQYDYDNADINIGRELTVEDLSGSVKFVINTDLVAGESDTIAIKSGSGQHMIKVAYAPSFIDNEAANGNTVNVISESPTGMIFSGAATDFGAYTYLPTLVSGANGGYDVSGFTIQSASGQSYNTLEAGVGTLALWRRSANNLERRLGELRDGGSSGIWARVYKGEQQLASLNGGRFSQDYSGIQGGYDQRLQWGGQTWHVGYMIDYLHADNDYSHGNGSASAISLGGYGTWLGERGHYLDLVIRQGRLRTNYNSLNNDTAIKGSYRNWGSSFTAEYGKRQNLQQGWYIEPQVELTLSRVSGDSYHTSDGTSVKINGENSVMGRIGTSIGRQVGSSKYYANVSWAKEFTASPSVRLANAGQDWLQLEQNLTDSWLEASIGVSGRLNNQADGYLELSRSFGDVASTKWQVNMGLRWKY